MLREENKIIKKQVLLNLFDYGYYFINDTLGREIKKEQIEKCKNEVVFCKVFDSKRKEIIIY